MGVGERIRRYRKAGGYTQRGLAEEVGVTESAIRNYELGLRTPSGAQLEAIARALDVAPESLVDTGLMGARGALEMVFRLESEIGFRPVETEDGIGIAVDPKVEGSQKLSQALKAWARMRADLDTGKVSEAEYEAWKASLKVR
jgi:transcriptional regulator with XRE-family HTH domain